MIKVDNIESIKRNSAEFKKFLNSTAVESVLETVGNQLKPYLESATGDKFKVRIKPSQEPRAGVEVYTEHLSRKNFYNASVPKAVINFININGGSY